MYSRININRVASSDVNSMILSYGCAPTPFGQCWMVCSDVGVFALQLTDCEALLLADFRSIYVTVGLVRNDKLAVDFANKIFDQTISYPQIELFISGSEFRLNVWQKLIEIPMGQVVSYSDVANAIGRPTAVRAVANAVGSNRIGYLIPCHRVVRHSGQLGEFYWGVETKKAIQNWESLAVSSK